MAKTPQQTIIAMDEQQLITNEQTKTALYGGFLAKIEESDSSKIDEETAFKVEQSVQSIMFKTGNNPKDNGQNAYDSIINKIKTKKQQLNAISVFSSTNSKMETTNSKFLDSIPEAVRTAFSITETDKLKPYLKDEVLNYRKIYEVQITNKTMYNKWFKSIGKTKKHIDEDLKALQSLKMDFEKIGEVKKPEKIKATFSFSLEEPKK